MAVAAKLFVKDLSYKDLMNEYRCLSASKKKEVSKSPKIEIKYPKIEIWN